jgi:ABC-2 type transport system permease protein
MVRKEWTQLWRDKYLLAFIVLLPVAQLLVTGLAIQKDLRHIPTLVYNQDHHNASAELLNAFQQSAYFQVVVDPQVQSERDLLRQVKQGRYRLGLIIPADYARHLLTGDEPSQVRLVMDGTNANISKTLLDAARAVLSNHALRLAQAQRTVVSPAAAGPPVLLQAQVLNNPELSPSMFLIPGILGVIMHMMTVLLTSSSIVRERENGTLEQLMVSPILAKHLMLGKVLPYALIGLVDMVLTLVAMVGFFNIPISGGVGLLFAASTLFIFTSLAVGLLISTLCKSQTQSVQLTLGLLLPSLLLSGFVFPIESMPWFIKLISYSLPLTYYLEVIRAIVIKGTGLLELWSPLGLLLGMTLGLMSLAILRFKKQVV